MGKSLQRWSAHDVAAKALARAGHMAELARDYANAHASLLGLQRRFDVAALTTYARGEETYLVYERRRGAAVGIYPIGSPEWLIKRALLTLTNGRRHSRRIWMNTDLYELGDGAPCLPIGILRQDVGGRRYIDRTSPRPRVPRSIPVNQLRLACWPD
jgi:hypothetical protein